MLRCGALIQQAVAEEIHKLAKFLVGQENRRDQQRIDARQDRLAGTAQQREVRANTSANRIVVARGGEYIEMMAHGVFQSCKAAVVKERWLQRDVAQR